MIQVAMFHCNIFMKYLLTSLYICNSKVYLQVLQETDEEIRNNFSELLARFYLAFESIHKYITDLNFYVKKLNQEDYQSSGSAESSEDGKQLMV